MSITRFSDTLSRRTALAGLGSGELALAAVVVAGRSSLGLAQEGTPAVEMTGGDETLLSVTVERDQLPSGEALVILGRDTYEPGARGTCACPDEEGTVIYLVESGAFTATHEEGGRIIRQAITADASEELAPAGESFTLSAGDAVVFPGKMRVTSNEGSEPATYLFALILAPVGPPEPDPTDLGERTSEILGVVACPWPELGSESVAIQLWRTSLDAGASLAGPAGGVQVVVPNVAPADPATPTALAAGDDGSTTNSGADAIEVVVLTLTPAAAATPAP